MNIFSQLFGSPSTQLRPEQVYNKLGESPKPFLMDVRQPEEYVRGHIQGATLIPLGELSRHLHRIPRNREVICVCRSGNRSNTAVRQLASAGIQASNLKGGMIHWASAGLPVKKGR